MILEDKQLLYSLLEDNLLFIKEGNHKRTWEYYYEQYHKAFCALLEVAKQKKYKTNYKFMPFLFIMRHSLELYLKGQIANISNKAVPPSHNISDLYNMANINDGKFLESFACLQCDSDGACWRYLFDIDGNRYFDKGERIEAFDACNYYCLFLDNDNSLTKDGIDKMLQWELTFHIGECSYLGVLGTQYDSTIIDLLHAIKDKLLSINDVYVPMLFLIRHCLEIKFKAAIIELGDVVKKNDLKKIYNTHSVRLLCDMLSSYIDAAIELMDDSKLKKQSEDLRSVTKRYTNLITSLDANSFLFRFPKDRNGKNSNFVPKSNCISEILKLYWESDLFLCFAVPVLYEAGVLNIGNDKEREYYE
jgi:hypothetical protein